MYFRRDNLWYICRSVPSRQVDPEWTEQASRNALNVRQFPRFQRNQSFLLKPEILLGFLFWSIVYIYGIVYGQILLSVYDIYVILLTVLYCFSLDRIHSSKNMCVLNCAVILRATMFSPGFPQWKSYRSVGLRPFIPPHLSFMRELTVQNLAKNIKTAVPPVF